MATQLARRRTSRRCGVLHGLISVGIVFSGRLIGLLDSIEGRVTRKVVPQLFICNVIYRVPAAAKKITSEGEINEKSEN